MKERYQETEIQKKILREDSGKQEQAFLSGKNIIQRHTISIRKWKGGSESPSRDPTPPCPPPRPCGRGRPGDEMPRLTGTGPGTAPTTGAVAPPCTAFLAAGVSWLLGFLFSRLRSRSTKVPFILAMISESVLAYWMRWQQRAEGLEWISEPNHLGAKADLLENSVTL